MDRVYTDKMLLNKSKDDLRKMINMVQVSDQLTAREKELNIDILELKLSGGVKQLRNNNIRKDIAEGLADMDDLGRK